MRAYPAEVAPFAAVERDGDALSGDELATILGPGGAVYFAHRLPRVDDSVVAESRPDILQMRWTARHLPALERSTPPIHDLGEADLDAMVDLTRASSGIPATHARWAATWASSSTGVSQPWEASGSR